MVVNGLVSPAPKPRREFALVNAGTMGEESVLRALLGPDIKFSTITLNGFEVRRQSQPPKDVWGAIKKVWDDRGTAYPGAYGLVPVKGRQAVVGCVTFSSPEQVKEAVKLLDEWDFHNRKRPKDGWFRYQTIGIKDRADTVFLTEMLNDSSLVPVADNYQEEQGYKDAVEEMERQAREFRESELQRIETPEGRFGGPAKAKERA